MILPSRREDAPSPFAADVLARLPLAQAVLSLWGYLTTDEFLDRIYQQYRGRSFEDALTFPVFVQLIADALTRHHGSGRKSFRDALRQGRLDTGIRTVYGKLGRLPLPLSLGFFHEFTTRLRPLLPAGTVVTALPASLDGLAVVVVDGKKIKRVAKRLLQRRGLPGKVYGGKLLVAYLPRQGLAVALAADPNGEANDIRLLPALLPQARACIAGPRLWVLDRQFCDLDQPQQLSQDGNHYLIRFSLKTSFQPDAERPARPGHDREVRPYTQEWGWMGAESDRRRRYVRHITLARSGAEAILLVTDLLDADRYPAADLLAVYLARWQIEGVFQQITEVFDLRRLIGSTPQATVFQAALCLVLYNLVQVVRAYIAAGRPEPTPVSSLSAEKIFDDLREELIALHKMLDVPQVLACVARPRTAAELVAWLQTLLSRAWSPEWVKAKAGKRRPKAKAVKKSGAHTSVHKVLEADRRRRAKQKAEQE
ncbi:MAG TPA: transposase [Gemmataceae bacterium]|jgi:hypothetical protein